MLTSRDQILTPQPDNIPQVLKDALRWTNWRAESSKKKPGTLDKVPYCSKNTRRKASHSDPATWAEYIAAYDAYRLNGEPPLDGFFFACGDGFGGIDIDECVDPQTGEIAPFAWEAIQAINSYTEKSVSGTGIRIFVRMPEAKGTKHHPFEIYSSKRFLSVTGHHVSGTPLSVEERGQEVEVLRRRVLEMRAEASAAKQKTSSRRPSQQHHLDQPLHATLPNVTALGISDDEVIKTCHRFKGFTPLWEGDWSAYESHSNADMALAGLLAFACGPGEHERVERLMRRSGLYREEKCDRPDYLPELTIPKAYEGRTDYYPWPSPYRSREAEQDTRPTIVMGPETDAILRKLEEHLSPHLFQRHGDLVSITETGESQADASIRRASGTHVLSEVSQEQVHRLMSRHVVFTKRQAVGHGEERRIMLEQVPAPANLAKLFTNCGSWSAIPNLVGLTTTPFLRPDGHLVEKPGYDRDSGYVFIADGLSWESIPVHPTPRQVQAAIDLLLDLVCDFPFEAPEHRSAWIATLLSVVGRPAIRGPVPMLWTDGSSMGTGKTKLTRLIGLIVLGDEPTEVSFTATDEELEKRLASILIAGDRFACFDNMTGSVRNPVLDRFLTSVYFGTRLMFKHKVVKLRNTATLSLTGNNLTLRGDLSRRVVRARLVSDLEKPQYRTGFRHPDIEGYVRANRQSLFAAALTILRAHAVAGFPIKAGIAPLGSFVEWERVVRHAMLEAGLPDPVSTQEEVIEDDEEQSKLLAVLRSWHRFKPHLKGTATKIVAAAMEGGEFTFTPEHAAFREALRELTNTPFDRPPCAQTLGYRFRGGKDKRIAGYRVISDSGKGKDGVRWAVVYDGPEEAPCTAPQSADADVHDRPAATPIERAYGRKNLTRGGTR